MPNQWDEAFARNPDELIELEPGLQVRAIVWGALRQLAELPPELRVLTILVHKLGSYQAAARWLDSDLPNGKTPAYYLTTGRVDDLNYFSIKLLPQL